METPIIPKDGMATGLSDMAAPTASSVDGQYTDTTVPRPKGPTVNWSIRFINEEA
ncbi:hypothetical protein [Bifidobacterium myosotis]|uniref:hypothetical protein n=1 Tax=Bifidobacterium myosotis TaxID=1630166 RepID=UPI00168AEE5C|nr:hypothetical protein [Bifidobacterium myosotis]